MQDPSVDFVTIWIRNKIWEVFLFYKGCVVTEDIYYNSASAMTLL